ncbi:hypothetical protein GTID1_18165 (plasmid) [Geobacillus thermodenitrificans]|uniref:hypothetical protein n=1 Tax=Geobacillus thermodenitrificans TaxID=33940 RepID=UPI000C05BC1C|nr:hypothetical protein [Geobacillus thermodenitrificans]ATO39137.1 hypothetical protein GTID1_18165 [Geobacillus thermodenitrificans]
MQMMTAVEFNFVSRFVHAALAVVVAVQHNEESSVIKIKMEPSLLTWFHLRRIIMNKIAINTNFRINNFIYHELPSGEL